MNIHSDMDSSLTRFEALMLCVERAGSISQLGRDLGISKERVRQIETRALEKLKTALERNGPGMLPSAEAQLPAIGR